MATGRSEEDEKLLTIDHLDTDFRETATFLWDGGGYPNADDHPIPRTFKVKSFTFSSMSSSPDALPKIRKKFNRVSAQKML